MDDPFLIIAIILYSLQCLPTYNYHHKYYYYALPRFIAHTLGLKIKF